MHITRRLACFPVLAALLLISSCAAQIKQKFLDEPYRTGRLSVPLNVTGIEVADGRSAVDAEPLRAPKFSFRKKGDTVMPPLTIEQEKVIRDEIMEGVSGNGTGMRIKATLKHGEKQYTLGFFNAREYANATVTIDLVDGTTEPHFFSTTGEAYYEVKSTAADTVYLEVLYRKALKTSVYKALESVGGFLEKRRGQGTEQDADR